MHVATVGHDGGGGGDDDDDSEGSAWDPLVVVRPGSLLSSAPLLTA